MHLPQVLAAKISTVDYMDRCKGKLGDGPQIAIKRFWRLSWPDPLEFTFRLFFTILKYEAQGVRRLSEE
ncbi:hypothetical protein F2Q70_00040462 [Brassica cretica]|uniref:Uncharacterized protein n=1 Tax=Brassica cretica TaxID=69181 RepID=A0A8S9K7D1_BRACR|nr:hypothetical protein F2Q70_00040462 [Brassica cretica]